MSGDSRPLPGDLEDFGAISVGTNGQLTVPKEARAALRLAGRTRLYLFASASQRQAWLVATERSPAEIATFLAGRSETEAADQRDDGA